MTNPESGVLLADLYYDYYEVYKETKKKIESDNKFAKFKRDAAFEIENFGPMMYHDSENPYDCTDFDMHMEDYITANIMKIFGLTFDDYLKTPPWQKTRMLKRATIQMDKETAEMSEIDKQTEEQQKALEKTLKDV